MVFKAFTRYPTAEPVLNSRTGKHTAKFKSQQYQLAAQHVCTNELNIMQNGVQCTKYRKPDLAIQCFQLSTPFLSGRHRGHMTSLLLLHLLSKPADVGLCRIQVCLCCLQCSKCVSYCMPLLSECSARCLTGLD